MNKKQIILLLLIILFILLFINYYNIIAILNSHFGTNLSTQESDNKTKHFQNIVSKMYDDENQHYYNHAPFTHFIKPDHIPSIDISELTKDKFIKLSNNFTTPIVIKNFLKDSKAIKDWDLDFFAKNYGSTELPIIENADIRAHKNYIQTKTTEKYNYITISQFVDSIKKGGKRYANNVSRIFGLHPELLDYLDLEKIKYYTGEDIKNEVHITNLFIGGKGTGTSLHCSITGNFFYNIKGQKLWYLIDPKYSRYLKPLLSRTGLFAVSQLDICNAKPGDYPLNIPRFEVLLDEGDMLFNPPWYWHAITNKTDYTIACANRFTNYWSGFKNNPLFTIIFFSHPISNYNDFGKFKTREEANMEFDKALLSDILKENKKIN
jgi:hypothetical protein